MLKDDSLFLNTRTVVGYAAYPEGISRVVDWDWAIFFIPFERPYAGEVFDIKSSAGSLCVFPGERLQSAQNSTFFEKLSERLSRGLVWRKYKSW